MWCHAGRDSVKINGKEKLLNGCIIDERNSMDKYRILVAISIVALIFDNIPKSFAADYYQWWCCW